MNWRNNILFSALLLTSCGTEINMQTQVSEFSYLIEADELIQMIERPHVKLLDFRTKENYQQNHLPGAHNIWRTDIQDHSYNYAGVMASPSQIESLFGKYGFESADTIVIYDDNGLCNAARLWWILQNYDFEHVRLLHGGLEAWKSINGPLTSEAPIVEETVFSLSDTPSMKYYISKDEIKEASESDVLIVDTRSADEYSGKRQKKGAAKGGRIPSSIHMDWADNIDYHGDKRIKPLQALAANYTDIALHKEDPIIVYCHSGVRSAHSTFVLTQLLDYENVRNYDGSWTEWSYSEDLPFEQDSITSIQ